MTAIVWISGASSGIGAALAKGVPLEPARVIGISRRPPAAGEHLAADLSDPCAWRDVDRSFDSVLSERPARAMFLHFAGAGGPHGRTTDVDLDEYISAVLLNSAAGQVLGKAFLGACWRHGVPATVVLCSSPAAAAKLPGMSSYGSGKAALEYWVGAAGAEEQIRDGAQVFAVVPFAVDTPMLRDVMAQSVEVQPVAADLRDAAARGELATPEAAAAQIWSAVLGGTPRGATVSVGAVPPVPSAA